MRRPDYVRYTLIGSCYSQRKWLNDARSHTFKTISVDSPDYEPDARYLTYRLEESTNGTRSSRNVIISYEMFVAVSSFTNSGRYTSAAKMITCLADTVSFAKTCKHVNINRELDAKYNIIFETCRLFTTHLAEERFQGAVDLNCLRL